MPGMLPDLMPPELAPTLVMVGLAVLVLPSLPRDHPWGRAVVMGISILALGQYLVWRLTATLPPLSLQPGALWMWAVAVMEALTLANAMITALFLTRHSDRRAQADAGEARLTARASLPPVDVIIPTYNEPLEVVERSILGALALDWPHVRVWVLDDGKRPWLAEYCAAKGAHWVTRADNRDGKAGNVNAWLKGGGSAPYILVLDADFVPQRRFLRRVLGLFDDDGVALVQTPQSFFNPDPIQLNLLCGTALADEQRFFYHDFQPALDAWGASFCCGTSFVVRRDRLEAVGGVPTCSVTEDMMTTYALAARGWRTLYLNEPLSAGLAPEGLAEFVSQRARWCLGTVQSMRSPRSPFRARGIGWASRLCFLNAQLFWLAAVPMMLIAMVAPAVFWWTGTPAFLAAPQTFLAHFGPRFAAEAISIAWVSRWSVVPVLSGIAPLVIAPTAMAAAARALLKPGVHRFKVTLKGGDRGRVVVHVRLLAWLGALMAATAAGMVVGQIPELAGMGGGHGQAINLGWSAYALGILFLAMLVSVEVPRVRREERLPFREMALLDGRPAMLEDLSLGGACLRAETSADTVVMELAEVGRLTAQVVRHKGGHVFVRFTHMAAQRDALIRKLYTGPQALPGDTLNPTRALKAVMRRSFVSKV
ncbi:MAG: glycosyltransferase [Rhodospirillaceae bacterium]|nr:glycosyltransferase [Rhodospirillales bacterium]